jgi:hypothetical protein
MPKTRPRGKSKANAKIDLGLDDFLETQKKLTEDYLGNPRGKLRNRNCTYTLVRDPNGNYFLVSEKECPIPVKDKDQVHYFLQDLNDLVTDYIAKHINRELVAGPGVHVGTAEIFPK